MDTSGIGDYTPKECIDCHVKFFPMSPVQNRCIPCGVKAKKSNKKATSKETKKVKNTTIGIRAKKTAEEMYGDNLHDEKAYPPQKSRNLLDVLMQRLIDMDMTEANSITLSFDYEEIIIRRK